MTFLLMLGGAVALLALYAASSVVSAVGAFLPAKRIETKPPSRFHLELDGLARAGSVDAQFLLGHGLSGRRIAHWELTTQSVEEGLVREAMKLNEWPPPKDEHSGRAWMQMAAQNGHPYAALIMADLTRQPAPSQNGEGSEYHYWMTVAVDRKVPEAMDRLARSLIYGPVHGWTTTFTEDRAAMARGIELAREALSLGYVDSALMLFDLAAVASPPFSDADTLLFATTSIKASLHQPAIAYLIERYGKKSANPRLDLIKNCHDELAKWELHSGSRDLWLLSQHLPATPDESPEKPPRDATPSIKPARGGGFRSEGLSHRTASGYFVRSKSEVIIANALHYLGIPHTYERRLIGKDGSQKLPDFTVACPDGRLVLWEHLGMLNKESYRQAWASKLDWLCANGYTEGGNLFITKDDQDGNIDSRIVHETATRIAQLLKNH